MSRFPHAISPTDTSFSGHPFHDDAEQCDCMFATDPQDETWEILESEDDGAQVSVRCKCRVCDRKAWLRLDLVTVDERVGQLPQLVTQCCLCKQYLSAQGDYFSPSIEGVRWIMLNRRVSHGYCSKCAKMQMERFQNEKAGLQ